MKKPSFVENEIYHIYNRGTEKRTIFMDNKDYLRFIHDLFEFNDEDQVFNVAYRLNPKTMEAEHRYLDTRKKDRKLMVEILVFALMPNHFHLILKQKKKNGIVKFMQKMGTGYTMYFNKKYERVGGLFQGRFKAVLVHEEAHFIHLPFYIHANPLSLNYRGSTSIDFLENYKWSSFPDYIGKRNFRSVTSRKLFLDFFGGEAKYKEATKKWLEEREENTENIKDVILEK